MTRAAITTSAIRAFINMGGSDAPYNMNTNYSFPNLPIYWYNRSTATSGFELATSLHNSLFPGYGGNILYSFGQGTGVYPSGVWTGTDGTGAAQNACYNWTSASGGDWGNLGNPYYADGNWLNSGYYDTYGGSFRVMCVCVQN